MEPPRDWRCEGCAALLILKTFGDSLNDLSMLQRAGRGILMANGRADLRSSGDDLPSNQEDGVAEYLESLFHGR